MTFEQEALARASMGEPLLPLTEGQALAHGRRLRQAGVSYLHIARVMAVSHGVYQSSDWWRRNLRARGAPPRHFANSLRVSPTQRRLQEAA